MILKLDSPKYGLIEVLIDDDDYDRVSKHKWSVAYSNSTKQFYVRNQNMYLHRYILKLTKEDSIIDFKNRNTLDYRKDNLRICTYADNNRNHKLYKTNKTGYSGVYRPKNRHKYRAQIHINRKGKHLGCFNTKIEAARAYNKAAEKYFGEFASLNKIPKDDN